MRATCKGPLMVSELSSISDTLLGAAAFLAKDSAPPSSAHATASVWALKLAPEATRKPDRKPWCGAPKVTSDEDRT
jgi:hypothetical protein